MPAMPLSAPRAPAGDRLWLPAVAILAFALCWPFHNTVGWLGDEGVLLHGAERMLRGERLYADFFEFLPPGGFMLVAAWLKLFGTSVAAARWLAILAIVGIACLLHTIGRRITSDPRLAAMAALAWVLTSQGAWTQINHHWFTTLFSLIALWAVLRGAEHDGALPPLLAGIAAGAAGLMTSTRGALAAMAAAAAILAARRPIARLVLFACGVALVPGLALLFLAGQHSLSEAFEGVIIFPTTRYSGIQPVPFGRNATLQNLPLVLLFPATALLTLVLFLTRRRAAWQDSRLPPCLGFALAGFIGCYPRPDDVHIMFAAPLALPLFLLCTTQLSHRIPRLPRAALDILAAGLLAISALYYVHIAREAIAAPATELPRGTVKLSGASADAWRVLAGNFPAHAADGYLFYPYAPLLPFLTGLRHVAPYDVYTPHYSTPRHYQETCHAAMTQADWLVIDRAWTGMDMLGHIFPGMPGNLPEEVTRLEKTLEANFTAVARSGTYELRRRAPDASAAACDHRSE